MYVAMALPKHWCELNIKRISYRQLSRDRLASGVENAERCLLLGRIFGRLYVRKVVATGHARASLVSSPAPLRSAGSVGSLTAQFKE